MNTTTALFYVFSAVLLGASFRVITARSTVHAALFLVLAFFSASCVWMLLKAEFLAITLVLVYVGAVMVLFLFVVMMLDINTDAFRQNFWKHFPVAGLIGAVIALEMAAVLYQGFYVPEAPALSAAAIEAGNTKMLGIEMYTKYLYPLQIAAVLLLVAIGPMILATAMYQWRFWVPDSRNYHGALIGDGSQLADIGVQGAAQERWQLLVTTPGDCAEDCRQLVYAARQIHIGLNREAARAVHGLAVSRPLAADYDQQLQREYPQLGRYVLLGRISGRSSEVVYGASFVEWFAEEGTRVAGRVTFVVSTTVVGSAFISGPSHSGAVGTAKAYTDDQGTREYNERLATSRANTVWQYLTDKGLPPDKASVKSWGEENPGSVNDTEENRRQNRRVDIRATPLLFSGYAAIGLVAALLTRETWGPAERAAADAAGADRHPVAA